MLNGSGKSGHPCLIPDVRGRFQFFTINNVSCGFVVYGLYCIKLGLPYQASPVPSAVEESACNAEDAGDTDSISRWRRTPGGGHGNPLQ